MKTTPISRTHPGSASAPPDDRRLRLKKAAQEFEAIFVGYMLKAMRSTVPEDAETGGGFGGGILQGMFDMQLSSRVAGGTRLGVEAMLARRLREDTSAVPAERDGLSPLPAPVRRAPPAPGPERTAPAPAVPAADTVTHRLRQYSDMIEEAAARHGLDSNVVRAVIAVESGGDARARSPRNAKGLMQLTDSTAAAMGVRRIWDPRENIEGGVKYLRRMLERFDGRLELALASYNAGPGAVERHGGIPPFRETQSYVRKVTEVISTLTRESGERHEGD